MFLVIEANETKRIKNNEHLCIVLVNRGIKMEKIKTIIFWAIGIFFLINRFIRFFIHPEWGESIREVTLSLPLGLKILITFFSIAVLFWLFPYKNVFKKK